MTNIELTKALLEDIEQCGVREVGCTFGADSEDSELNIKDTVMAMESFWIIVE